MKLRDFRQVGHGPTLWAAALFGGIAMAVWALPSGLANAIGAEFHLSVFDKAFLAAVPCLGGVISWLILSRLVNALGVRHTGMLSLALTLVALLLGWLWADSYHQVLLVGLMLGVAGASLAVTVPLTTRSGEPEHDGLAFGLLAVANLGLIVAPLLGPSLAAVIGWRGVFGLALVPGSLILCLFAWFTRELPGQAEADKPSSARAVTVAGEMWRNCLFYGVAFGGFVGLASFLSVYWHDQYALRPVSAGLCAALSVLAGSSLSPVAGYLADRFGGAFLLMAVFAAAGLLLLDMATMPPFLWTLTLSVAIMAILGVGAGAVARLLPRRSPHRFVGTGVVGAAGGLGGFLVPALLGISRHLTGSYSGGFLLLALFAFVCIGVLAAAGQHWQGFVATGGLGEPAAGQQPLAREGRLAAHR